MIDQIITIYCICDEVCKVFELRDDPQCKMSTPEVMAFSIISAHSYGCNYRFTRLISIHLRLFSKILSLSQLVRRIHKIPIQVWVMVFSALQIFLRNKTNNIFIVDSFPVPAYRNHKSFRARIFNKREYHGYNASKKQYFFGIKVHMIIDTDGVPIEFCFTPANTADVKALHFFDMDLPRESYLLGDKAYNNYYFEDMIKNLKNIQVLSKRNSRHKRQHSGENNKLIKKYRNRIETVFSCITNRIPRRIQVRTEKGFCLKMFFFIIAYMLSLHHPIK